MGNMILFIVGMVCIEHAVMNMKRRYPAKKQFLLYVLPTP
jgi:hypothetical protein